MYLIWQDMSRASAGEKIQAGMARYREKVGQEPTIVLVNEMDMAVVPGIRVEASATVRPNNFWIGLIVEESQR